MPTLAFVCPGFHPPELTEGFIAGLSIPRDRLLVLPTRDYPPYLGNRILAFLENSVETTTPVLFIAFSAGVVGAISAAWGWQARSGRVKAFIALDGWGVPLFGNFPIHRLSHDYFTHWSSRGLGGGEESFYADPGVEHLQLWRSPQTTDGWWESGFGMRSRSTAAEYLNALWQRYCDRPTN